jgi:hypothetical protein
MASTSIVGHFTLHQVSPLDQLVKLCGPYNRVRCQPNASRHVENSMRRFSRSGAPVPERITRPSCNAHLRRAPRSRPAIQQPSPPRDYQQRLLRRSERLAQRVQTLPGTSSRRREDAPRHINVPLAQTQPSGSRHNRPAEPFPARRPHRTRYSPSEQVQDRRYEGHRGASVESFNDRAHEDYRSEYTKHRTLESPPPARHTRTARPSAPATNRWSFSSDSSTSSMECPATPTSSDAHIPWSHSYMEEFAREFEYVQQQEQFFVRRRLEMEEEMGWATKPSLFSRLDKKKPPVLVVPDNLGGEESLVGSCPLYEDDDMGQTTIYTNHDVIARDPRFAPPRERTQNLDGVLIVQPSSVAESLYEDGPGLKSRSADETESRKKEPRQGRRTAVFPMWAEAAPRDMLDKERDGIRSRYGRDMDESLPVSRPLRHRLRGATHDNPPTQ